jgi:hypothetical protein
MNAQEKYEIIKEVNQRGNKLRASLKLGCTVHHVNRLIQKYRQMGKADFIHGNSGRQPLHTFSDTQKVSIISIYNSKYSDINFTHCCELLKSMMPLRFLHLLFAKSFTKNLFYPLVLPERQKTYGQKFFANYIVYLNQKRKSHSSIQHCFA